MLKEVFAIPAVGALIYRIKDNKLNIESIQDMMFEAVQENTYCGLVMGKFDNDTAIKSELNAVSMPKFFEELKGKVREYYAG